MKASLVDVSAWNAPDWVAMRRSGIVAVYCKGTEGTGYTNPRYAEFRFAAAAHGLVFGAYLFHHPGVGAQVQVDRFLSYAQPRRGDLRPVIDTETADGHGWAAIAASVQATAYAFRAHSFDPIIYGSSSWLRSLYRADARLRRFDAWEAQYASRLDRIPGVRALLWQFTDHYPVGRGRLDGNAMLVRDLAALRIGGTPSPPPPVWRIVQRLFRNRWYTTVEPTRQ